MHDESAHLPETLNNATAKASLHMFHFPGCIKWENVLNCKN